jgi:DNA-binding NarL/FixJ family response regulator
MTTFEIPIKVINALIVDDHQMVRDGIKTMLETNRSLFKFNITEAENGQQAILKTNNYDFDIIIMDYQLPGMFGYEIINQIKLKKPYTKFLALSNYDEVSYVQKMLSAGATGFILKNIEPTQLINAISNVLKNKPYFSSEITSKLINAEPIEESKDIIKKYKLTKRELEVLIFIAQGFINEEISEKLFVSKRTIETHRQNLSKKLKVKNTAGLIKAAYKLKLI